jgi:dihydroneopterin aldolase
VHPQERAAGQLFVVDAELELDTRSAAASDDLSDTVDYGALAARLSEVVAGEPVRLLETLADRLAEVCLAEPAVRAVRVAVHKPEAPLAVPVADVSVTIRRERC